jgi:hypothetical protein
MPRAIANLGSLLPTDEPGRSLEGKKGMKGTVTGMFGVAVSRCFFALFGTPE